ncbi:hypothetical protein MPD81_000550 [Cronobacter sakazakii]|nr:hypothetical protein [Cronobacter sakazakii]
MEQKWYCCPSMKLKDRFMVLIMGQDVFLLFRKGGSLRKSRDWLARAKAKFIPLG